MLLGSWASSEYFRVKLTREFLNFFLANPWAGYCGRVDRSPDCSTSNVGVQFLGSRHVKRMRINNAKVENWVKQCQVENGV